MFYTSTTRIKNPAIPLISIDTMSNFIGKDIVITEKLDGESITMYSDYIHGKNIDGRYHSSRNWVKDYHNQIKHNIPIGDRLCGENLYAQHSIPYNNLLSYFYGIMYWSYNLCLDYDNTITIFANLDIPTPRLLYKGLYDDKIISNLIAELELEHIEGFVIRNQNSFHYDDFSTNVVKWIHSEYNRNDDWKYQSIISNQLQSERQ